VILTLDSSCSSSAEKKTKIIFLYLSNIVGNKIIPLASKKYVLKPSAGKLALKIKSFVAVLVRPGIFLVASETGISLRKKIDIP
jgi:hypothetical protein